MKTIYMYLSDTMADWESGYFLQALTLQNLLPQPKYHFSTVSLTGTPIQTAARITVVPDTSLDRLDEADIAALLLIGADNWMDREQKNILQLASDLLQKNVLVAAICGATLGLADIGILNARVHTSNAPSFLSLAPGYKGAAYYRGEAAVTDGALITAGSAGSLLWARHILTGLRLYKTETIDAWYHYFKTGDPKYYNTLIDSFRE